MYDALAYRVYVAQYEHNRVYRALCDARSATPETVESWRDTPLVPARAFKSLELASVDPSSVDLVFRTSGTSRGRGFRGRHFVPWPELYHASLLPNFRRHLLPEGRPLPLLSLTPSPADAPDSSLSYMVGAVAEELCTSVVWCVDAGGTPVLKRFLPAARKVTDSGGAALLVGTAFAFVHLLDRMTREGLRVALPGGSRIMETGGFKGRTRTVSRDELYSAVQDRLGIPPSRVVNEYGMTELLSQLYEPVLLESSPVPRRHIAPPWLRVRALDPLTLRPVSEGEEGLLSFFDLANLGSVAHVLTEDVGRVHGQEVHLRGRAPGAEARGCSLAMDELMSVTEGV